MWGSEWELCVIMTFSHNVCYRSTCIFKEFCSCILNFPQLLTNNNIIVIPH